MFAEVPFPKRKVSNQLISLTSRDKIQAPILMVHIVTVSNQLISLTSRDPFPAS